MTFTVDVRNTTIEAVTIVSITDSVDGGNAIDITQVGDDVLSTSCATGVEIAVGDTYSCSFDLNVVGDGSSSVLDLIEVTVVDDDGNQVSDTDGEETPVDPVADVSLIKSVVTDGPIAPGDTVVYQLTVTNNGPSAATELIVTDALPAALTLTNANGDGWDCTASTGNNVRCRRAAQSNGTSSVISITATVNSGQTGSILNTASVDAETPDPVDENNTDDADIDLAIVLPPQPQTPPPPLAFTGRNIGTLLFAAFAMVLFGYLMTLVPARARRRP